MAVSIVARSSLEIGCPPLRKIHQCKTLLGREPTPVSAVPAYSCHSGALLAPMSLPAYAASSFAVSSMWGLVLRFAPLLFDSRRSSTARPFVRKPPRIHPDDAMPLETPRSPSTRTRGDDEHRRGLEGAEEEAKNELSELAFGKRRSGSDLRKRSPVHHHHRRLTNVHSHSAIAPFVHSRCRKVEIGKR
jgi:hypothetical protein